MLEFMKVFTLRKYRHGLSYNIIPRLSTLGTFHIL